MVDLLIAKLHDPRFMMMLMAAIAVSATAYTLLVPLLASDGLAKRMKAVANERERLRQRERDRMLNTGKVSLRQTPKQLVSKVVSDFNLTKWLAQEAALDKFLTGREHLKLQGALHGMKSAELKRRSDELLERVGLMEAADRKVGGYSGGMKRRLDLALALLHGPRVLFLDEPTTGLDPQSRTALWDEVARLSREDGVTVFLTTQYLEEADALANRVGIIDHGHIVIEGTPDELKASVGRSSVEIEPHDAARLPDLERALAPFGTAIATRGSSASIRLDEGVGDVAAIVRALDSTGIAIHQLRLREPTLDDVFLEQTGRSLEGSGGASDEDGAEQ